MKSLLQILKYIIYVVAILLILWAANNYILRPALQRIEESKTITKIEEPNKIIVYVQAVEDVLAKDGKVIYEKDELITAKAKADDLDCIMPRRLKSGEVTCAPEGQYKILSTDTEQDLIKQAIGSEYGKDFKKDSIVTTFKDINKDGIEDMISWQRSEPTSSIGQKGYTVYSATDNKVLWGLSKTINYHSSSSTGKLDVSIISNQNVPDTIVIRGARYKNLSRYNRYAFYKYQDNQYVQVEPNKEDWKSYWKQEPFKIKIIEFY